MSAEGGGYVGRRVLRREDAWLTRGAGQFVDDVPVPRNTLHLALALSNEAHAGIAAIDCAKARAVPGVHDVLTGDDIAAFARPICTRIDAPGYRTTARDLVARAKVRFVGETVALVLAETPYAAQDGVEQIEVEYMRLRPVTTYAEAVADGAPKVHDGVEDNILFRTVVSNGEVDAGFADAFAVVEETFTHGRVAPVALEPRGCVAIPERGGDSITLYTSTQVPHIVRSLVAECAEMPESRLRVVVPDVGGGFGMKAHVFPEEVLVVALARKYGRAVKWIQDRREDLLTNPHAREHEVHLRAAVDVRGRIIGLRSKVRSNAGAYSSYPYGCTLEPLGVARMLVGPYRIRAYEFDALAFTTNTAPTGAYRGTGQPTAFFAMEGIMDRIARRLELDPAEVRLRNMVGLADMPYASIVGARYDTGDFVGCLRKAMTAFDYEGARKAQMKTPPDGKLRGIGICCFIEVTGIGAKGWAARGVRAVPGYDAAQIRVEPNGAITAFLSQANSGQGHFTTFAQLVADRMGAKLSDVTVLEGDTSSAPFGTGSIASRGTVACGGAVIRAADVLTGKMKRIASDLLEADAGDIVLRDSFAAVAGAEDVRVSFKEIAAAAHSVAAGKALDQDHGLNVLETYDPPYSTMANAVHIVGIALDPVTGELEIERYVVVHDCGKVINPMIVEGQIAGGVVQGLGEAVMEQIVYDDEGQMINATLLDYLIPTSLDVPRIEIHHMESPTIDALGGFKGVGEGGLIGAVPAIGCAVFDALKPQGVNVNGLPLKPDVVVGLLNSRTRDDAPCGAAAPP